MTVRAGIRGEGRKVLIDALGSRKDFATSGSFRGSKPTPGILPYLGRLSADEAQALRDDCHDLGLVYVVYSYDTPIAWCYNDGEGGVNTHIVNQSFSVTTSRHQGFVRTYLR